MFVDNPDLIPRDIRDKNIIMDVYMKRSNDEVNIEMQKSLLSKYIYRRFQYYAAKMIAYQLNSGDSFLKVKDIYQIILIEDYDRNNPKLVETFHAKQQIGDKALPFYVHTSVYVYLPFIEKIAEKKKKLNEFEALFYLIHKGTLEGIEYEEKEGVIEMIELLHRDFTGNEVLMEATMARYQKREDFQAWHDMDVEDAKEQGNKQGIYAGKQETLKAQIELKFGVHDCEWLNECTEVELDKLLLHIFDDIEYEELKSMK